MWTVSKDFLEHLRHDNKCVHVGNNNLLMLKNSFYVLLIIIIIINLVVNDYKNLFLCKLIISGEDRIYSKITQIYSSYI